MKTRIVIIGGGAAGLELATRLGNKLGENGQAEILLVDANLTHLWKPLWHEVAAGTLYSNEDELNYIVHAHRNYFNFQLGAFSNLDKNSKTVVLNPLYNDQGDLILPERKINYDILIFAIGSLSNDFNISGVNEHCHFLDSQTDCHQLHRSLLNNLLRLQEEVQKEIHISIIGGGATGVELASELQFSIQTALEYKKPGPAKAPLVKITLIEGKDRILADLPQEISQTVKKALEQQGIEVFTNEKVEKVDEQFIYTNKQKVKADLKLWAAGIKAPEVFKKLGFTTDPLGRLMVKQTLQSIDNESIFALGDCANCPQANGKSVPPRAQAAQQEAKLLAKSLERYIQHQALLEFVYQDRGSLVALSQSKGIGQLMRTPLGKITLEGKLAQFAYRFLYRQHQAALYGWPRVALLCFAYFMSRPIRPRLKLH